MALDIKITGIETDRNLNSLICGHPGAGKTLTSSTYPHPFYISCEGGLLSIRKRKVPFVELKDPRQMDELIKRLRQPPAVREKQFGLPVETVVVDTIDGFQKLLKRQRLSEVNRDVFQMLDWGWLGESMRSYVAALRGLDMNVVVTCHLKRIVEEETGKVTIAPGLEGSYRDDIAGDFDIVGILEQKTKKVTKGKEIETITTRVLRTQPDLTSDWLKDRSGVLPGEFEINLEDDYKRMSAMIFADLDAMDAQLEDELNDLQKQLDAAVRLTEQVVEVAPEPAEVEEVPAVEVKASKELDSDAETVNSEQFDTLIRMFVDYDDDDKRVAAKHAFKAEFGNPAQILASRYDEAVAWIEKALEDARSVPEEIATDEVVETAEEAKVDVTSPDAVACTFPGCTVKDIGDEDTIELSKIRNGNKPLCPKHLRETTKK